jgi:inorganic pyrophosphatase
MSERELVPFQDGLHSVSMQAGIRLNSSELEFQQFLAQLCDDCAVQAPVARTLPERTLMMHHPWHNVTIGEDWPRVLNAVIEIPAYSRVKTELDHRTGLLKLDRILKSSIIYPANYGFVPETLANETDPLDILVLCQLSVPCLTIVKCRPIGVVTLVRQGILGHKIIAVAIDDPEYGDFTNIERLPPFKRLMIVQFFNDYSTVESGAVTTKKPEGPEDAIRIITEARTAYRRHFDLEDE